MIDNTLEKPCIYVCVSNPEASLLKEVLAGIEEESLPYNVKKMDFDESTMLKNVYLVAQKSTMGIAVGIVGNRMVLQHNKLREDIPLIDIKLNFYDKEKARKIGCNTARLYKVMPFKDVDNTEGEMVEKIRAIVLDVIRLMKINFY